MLKFLSLFCVFITYVYADTPPPVYKFNSPLTKSGVNIGCQLSSGAQNGCLSSTDWSTFNSKQSLITAGSISTSTSGINITNGASSTFGPNVTLNILTSSGSQSGLLSSADWTTFNNKQSTVTPGTISTSTEGVSVGSGSNSTFGPNVTLDIQTASGSQPGLLSASDWTTFNSKQMAGSYITGLTGDVSATGPGSVSSVVNSVGGSSAANVHTAELLANAATDANTFSTIVKRNSAGVFSTTQINGGLTASGNFTLDSTSDSTKGTIFINPNTTGKVSISTSQTSYPFQYGDFTATAGQWTTASVVARTWAISDSPTALSLTWKSFNFVVQPNIGTTQSSALYRSLYGYAGTGAVTNIANTANYYGVTGLAELRAAGGVGNLFGGQFTAQLFASGTKIALSNGSLVGVNATSVCDACDASIGYQSAVFAQVNAQDGATVATQYSNRTSVGVSGTSTVTTSFGGYTRFDVDGTASIGTAYGYYVADNISGAGNPISTHYGMYVDTLVGSVAKWAFYNASTTNPNYFAGHVITGSSNTDDGASQLQVTGDEKITSGNMLLNTAGKGLQVKTGSNAKSGHATCSSGTAVVSNTSITANSHIQVTVMTPGGTHTAAPYISSVTATTGFTITCSGASDTSVIGYDIIEEI